MRWGGLGWGVYCVYGLLVYSGWIVCDGKVRHALCLMPLRGMSSAHAACFGIGYVGRGMVGWYRGHCGAILKWVGYS